MPTAALRDEASELRPLARTEVGPRGEEGLARGVAIPAGCVEADGSEHLRLEVIERVAAQARRAHLGLDEGGKHVEVIRAVVEGGPRVVHQWRGDRTPVHVVGGQAGRRVDAARLVEQLAHRDARLRRIGPPLRDGVGDPLVQ